MLMNLETEAGLRNYANGLNLAERCYARQYLEWLLGRGARPERPADVSHVAARAIRMRMEEGQS